MGRGYHSPLMAPAPRSLEDFIPRLRVMLITLGVLSFAHEISCRRSLLALFTHFL
jgi:hypothetical protein